jgi:hypothetical protein
MYNQACGKEANHTHNKIPHHVCQDNQCLKKQKIINVGEDKQESGPLHTIGGIVKWCSSYVKYYEVSLKN